jgi:hypothetical protein
VVTAEPAFLDCYGAAAASILQQGRTQLWHSTNSC